MKSAHLQKKNVTDQNLALNALLADTVMLSNAAAEGKLSARADASKHEGTYAEIVRGMNAILDAVVGPVNITAKCLEQISRGAIPAKITDTYNGDFNTIKNDLNNCADGLGGLVEASAVLSKMANNDYTSGVEGTYEGVFGSTAVAVNLVRERVLHVISTVKRVSQGELEDLPEYKKIGRRSEADELVPALTEMMFVLQRLGKEMARLTEASKDGQLSDRGKPEQFQGAYSEIVSGVNNMLDAILLPIGEGNRILAQISKGKIDELIAQTYKGDHEKMKQAVNNIAVVVQSLHKELARLAEASKDGRLSDRGKPEQFQGAYAEIVLGVNTMLDAILLPIGEGNRILSLVRGGNLREKVEIACKGDHAKMKDAVNGVHAWLIELTAYATKIANGDMTATMSKASDADQIHEWLVAMKNNINGLIADVSMLSKAAVDGKLAARADASKHSGEYRKIVEGFNATLDAVIGPLNMAAKYVDDISKGKVPAKITDAYNGDFNTLKNNLNACIDGLGGLVEANEVLQLMAANDYTVRVQGSYQGIFAEVGKATNKTADTLRGSMEMLGQNVQALSSAAEELTATSQQMSANAEETSAQTKVVSAATLSVSQNLQTVATGAEEMGASIKEIAKNATEAAKVATSAVKVAETANTTVSKLGDSSHRDRPGDQGHHFDRAADQLAGSERDH